MAAPDVEHPHEAPAPRARRLGSSRGSSRWVRVSLALAFAAAGLFTAYAGALVLLTSRAVERSASSVVTVVTVGGVLLLCAVLECVVAYRVAVLASLRSRWLASLASVASLAGLGFAVTGILPYRILFWAWLASALVLGAFVRARRTRAESPH
ncbi:MAG: hypothetical protein DCC71_10600 [Proteobacteria bacterium]|nr:MAG: hypothetical protein DCC71_10600 [Pseudomonadota bacterium]